MSGLRPILGLLAVVVLIATACSTADPNAQIDPIGPDRATFKPVGLALMQRCGSIDCHGSRYRNMRLYGFGGIRLDPNDRPDTPKTTPAELDADYDAVIGVEPEIMRAVALAKGAGSDRLTFIRKGRGEESHKGGNPITAGDDADVCIQSWFRGVVDADACQRVVDAP